MRAGRGQSFRAASAPGLLIDSTRFPFRVIAADTQTATDRQARLNAARALANEAARIAATDSALVPAARSYRVAASGQISATGAYLVSTTKTVRGRA